VKVYGAVVSSPSFVWPLKNSTFVMLPSVSDAVAVRSMFAGAVNVAPFAGCVSATVGSESPWRVTMRATDGTPFELMMKSM